MSDMGEDFRALREHNRDQREARREAGIPEILMLRTAGHHVREMGNGFQFRIDGVLDLYPTNRRYHHLKSGTRGRYTSPQKIVDQLLK